jgi:DNA-binding transcriptional MerR regulator
MTEIVQIELEKLILDFQNPRLVEFGITKSSKEEEILEILWDEMAVNELMYSIVLNGFWTYEPLIVVKNGDKYVAVEGNRRLAAVKLIHNPRGVKIPLHISKSITDNLLKQTSTLPCLEVENKEESWRFIGFKHVNGPAKWGSFAKAKYIAEIHNDYNVPINDIAYQIGDTHNTAQKLYQGLMVLEQAESNKVYNRKDVQSSRIYFSHLYTGLQREGIRSYLDIKAAEDESPTPVPNEKIKELGQLLEWLWGSKKNDTQPLIKSQNPDLKHLDEALQSKESIAALHAGESLSYAHELSRDADILFEESLSAAKRNLIKARGYMTTGFQGEENLVKVAGSVANLADDLYNDMYKKFEEEKLRKKKNRLTD